MLLRRQVLTSYIQTTLKTRAYPAALIVAALLPRVKTVIISPERYIRPPLVALMCLSFRWTDAKCMNFLGFSVKRMFTHNADLLDVSIVCLCQCRWRGVSDDFNHSSENNKVDLSMDENEQFHVTIYNAAFTNRHSFLSHFIRNLTSHLDYSIVSTDYI